MDRTSEFYSKPSTMSNYPIYQAKTFNQRGGMSNDELNAKVKQIAKTLTPEEKRYYANPKNIKSAMMRHTAYDILSKGIMSIMNYKRAMRKYNDGN